AAVTRRWPCIPACFHNRGRAHELAQRPCGVGRTVCVGPRRLPTCAGAAPGSGVELIWNFMRSGTALPGQTGGPHGRDTPCPTTLPDVAQSPAWPATVAR